MYVFTSTRIRFDQTVDVLTSRRPDPYTFWLGTLLWPREDYVLSENFVIVRRFSQTLQAHKLNMIKREKLAGHPRTIWRIWTCDVTPTSRISLARSLVLLSTIGSMYPCLWIWSLVSCLEVHSSLHLSTTGATEWLQGQGCWDFNVFLVYCNKKLVDDNRSKPATLMEPVASFEKCNTPAK